MTSPVILVMPIRQGTITNIEVEFPAGCQGLTYVRLLYETVPLLPHNPTIFLVSDDRTIQSPVEFEADIPPYEITAIGYNLDDTYTHTLNIGITLQLPKDKSIADLMIGV
jgi:hypothetical protein